MMTVKTQIKLVYDEHYYNLYYYKKEDSLT